MSTRGLQLLVTVVVAGVVAACASPAATDRAPSSPASSPVTSPASATPQTSTPAPTVTTATSMPTTAPTPTGGATQTPSATPIATPLPSSTPSPTPSLEAGRWLLERISRQSFGLLAAGIGADGALHAAAARGRNIVYLTSAGGSWTSQPLGLPVDAMPDDRVVSVAVDESGTVAAAFERRDCAIPGCMESGGVVLVADVDPRRGSWDMTEIGDGLDPDVAVHDGNFHVVYLAGEWSDDVCSVRRPAWYVSGLGGESTPTRLTRDAYAARVAVAADGTPVFAIENVCDALAEGGYIVTVTADGRPRLDPIPEIGFDSEAIQDLSIDSASRVHVMYMDMEGVNRYQIRERDGWTEAVAVSDGLRPVELAVDTQGVAHVVGYNDAGFWYASNASGSFSPQLITEVPSPDYCCAAWIEVEPSGTPHVLFTVPDESGEPTELWHAVPEPVN